MRYFHSTLACVAFAALAAFTSCNYDEDELTPSGVTSSYQLPQGSHDYDATIQKFYEENGVYLLYKFSNKDAYWTPSGWTNGTPSEDNSGKQGFTVKAADETYVGQQVNLLNEVWFSKLSATAKKRLLPTIILLCSEVNNVVFTYDFFPVFKSYYAESPILSHYNYANLCVTYGSSAITSLTEAQKKEYANSIIESWAEYISEHKAEPTSEFSTSIDYSSTAITYLSSPAECCAAGTLNAGYNTTAVKDWQLFLDMMMLYPESYLTEDAGDLSNVWSFTNYVNGDYVYDYEGIFHGILNLKRDTKGLLKQRYDIVRNYFITNYDFDPQSVGNSRQ